MFVFANRKGSILLNLFFGLFCAREGLFFDEEMEDDEAGVVGDINRWVGSDGGVINVVFILSGMHLLVDLFDALRRLWR